MNQLNRSQVKEAAQMEKKMSNIFSLFLLADVCCLWLFVFFNKKKYFF